MGTGRAPYMNGTHGYRRGGPNQIARTGLWEIGRRRHPDWHPDFYPRYYGPGRGGIFRNNHFYNPNFYFGGPYGPGEDDDSDDDDFPEWIPRRRRAPRRVRDDDGPRRLPWNENNFFNTNNIPVNANMPNIPFMPHMHNQNFPHPLML